MRTFTYHRGQKLQPGQKLVGRTTPWGNPFPVEGKIDPLKPPRLVSHYAEKWGVSVESLICKTDEEAVRRYREALEASRLDYTSDDVRRDLSGFDLGCPCASFPCHATVLVEITSTE